MRIHPSSSLLAVFAGLCAAQTSYTYDSGGRVTKITYASGSIVYGYDAAGHMISRTPVTGTGGTISSVTTAYAPASAGIAQNTWIQIKGTNLVPATTAASGVVWSSAPEFTLGQMPVTLGGLSVTINNKPAFVYFYCSAATSSVCTQDQINVLSPIDSSTGSVPVVVTNNGVATPPFQVTMNTIAPALFSFDGSHVTATHLNYSLIGPASLYPGLSTPAAPGETIIVYGTGFGIPSSATVASGAAVQSGAYSPAPVCTVGGTNAPVGFAGLAGVGLVQLNITVPATVAAGDSAISCTVGGESTPTGDVLTVSEF